MMNGLTRFFIQQGSSSDLRVSDESAWYVIRQTWPDATSARHTCQIERKCVGRDEAIELCEIYNAPPEPLGALAEWSNISYNTLIQAARAKPQRLKARKVSNSWMSTKRDVYEYQAWMIPKPRK